MLCFALQSAEPYSFSLQCSASLGTRFWFWAYRSDNDYRYVIKSHDIVALLPSTETEISQVKANLCARSSPTCNLFFYIYEHIQFLVKNGPKWNTSDVKESLLAPVPLNNEFTPRNSFMKPPWRAMQQFPSGENSTKFFQRRRQTFLPWLSTTALPNWMVSHCRLRRHLPRSG